MYMLVTADEYELPLAVFDRFVDARDQLGVRGKTIYLAAQRHWTIRCWNVPARLYKIEEEEPMGSEGE